MKSPEYENYYDNKFHIFEDLKMEVPDTEFPHSDCNVNNEKVSEDKELSKFNDQNEINHVAIENRLPLNVTVKIETIKEEEILDNEDISVPYKLTAQEVQLNSDERLLKDNVNLSKPNNEQTNSPRVAELNELNKCKLCFKYFDHHDDMLIHISLVHNEKTFKCELCGKQLNKLSNLKRHITLLHKHKEPLKVAEIIFKCTNCNAEFNNKFTLNNHAKLCQKEEEIIAYKCDSCDGVYKSDQNLRRHMKKMHTNKEHKCKVCSAVFKKNQYLRNHMKNVHNDYGRTFDCWCGKQFRSPLHLYHHKRRQHKRKIKHTDNNFQCDSCQKNLKTRLCLVKHIKTVHYDIGRTFVCWCGKQFQSLVHMRHHKQTQLKCKFEDTDNDSFQCDSCQKIFRNKGYLVTHIKRYHYDYGRTFGCWCGKQYRSPLHLYRHKWQHERNIKYPDIDRFQCDSCQKVFKNKGNLVTHIMRFHYEYGRTFDCWCGKQYRSPLHLSDHKRWHERKIKDTNNGRFQCDSCQFIFKRRQCLVIHIKRVHYDYGRTFDCWCGKQFRSPIHLYRHKQCHERKINDTDKDQFQRDSCQKIFKNKPVLVKHIMNVHYDYGRTFGCWCGKQFRSPLHLYEHKRRHDRNIKDTDNVF